MGGIIATSLVAFISMFVPGLLLALALLYKRTDLHLFEIVVIGFIFGLIAPAALTWVESFLIPYSTAFIFSLSLFEINALVLTIAGAILCFQQGVFKGFSLSGMTRSQAISKEEAKINEMQKASKMSIDEIRTRLSYFDSAKGIIEAHKAEEDALVRKHKEERSIASKLDERDRAKLSELHQQEEQKLIEQHEREEEMLLNRLSKPEAAAKSAINIKTAWPWILLLAIMLLTFATRIFGIGPSPQFYEFDPYYDMMAAQSILVYGQQFYTSHAAWPIEVGGSVMRIQPLVPYLEAYWYSLANYFGPKNSSTFSTNLMSYVGSVYPPMVAALLVFTVFVLLYREYGKYVGLIGASLAASMPVIFTTFVAGEQLLEPWGIFSLFFFFAMYVLAIRDMKNSRLAILAGVAFASTFLGAHYYTVDAGVLAAYILLQGTISVIRGDLTKYFYKMNIIIIVVIGIFLVAYNAYSTSITSAIPKIVGVPTTIAFPIIALVTVVVLDYVSRWLAKSKFSFKERLGGIGILVAVVLGNVLAWIYLIYANVARKGKYDPHTLTRIVWIGFFYALALIAVFFTPLGKPFKGYINLSAHYTTPSIPLFMTVEEYIPTGLFYNFGASGFGLIGSSIGGIPILVWIISAVALLLIIISIAFRNSKTGILYAAIALPLMIAGFSEVKYLPHFGVAFIMLFCIIIGEILLLADSDFSIKKYAKIITEAGQTHTELKNAIQRHANVVYAVLAIGLFFISTVLAIIMLLAILFVVKPSGSRSYLYGLLFLFIIIEIAAVAINHQVMLGESSTIIQAFTGAYTYATNPVNACSIIANHGNAIADDMFCNLVPAYWLNAMAWIKGNVGPFGYRVLAWWDYGDWINWFGNSPAVLRGDNSAPPEDYATAAHYVLGSSDGYGPQTLASFMNGNQTKYVLMDQDLIAKWQALDFLACVDINATSKAYAIAQGKAQNPPVPYALGTSQCEIAHDPQFVLVPLPALIPTNSSVQSISYYCKISNSTTPLISSYIVQGMSLSNETVCVDSVPNTKGVLSIFNQSGGKLNAVVQSASYEGVITISGIPFVEYLMIYLPNGPNDTITNAPSSFYDSNYYKGFILGDLPGFTQVYPANATGINFVNGTYGVRIYELDNFTGSLPPKTPKPSYVSNNYTMPG
ncbi:MAG: hypothetical protein M1160_02375 [Candidatus Marsarchaeota archaeon]|jgi:hypothetical protein|nr:hypothetical protein [Candidatus Marsarchaeota archaeon]MCL5111704.1 hypothetical protein [Candidatus Marsarchaeota archaeon]